MREKSKLTSSQWVASLAKEELPAITSIAGILEKFSNDDRSSIPKLSKVILHDQALSSSLLKVANSSSRSPVKKVTTVSRASIFLGIHAVKNICLTAKVLDGLLNSKHLRPAVYERLMKLMANAFYAGLLARMMVPDYEETTQEEVYLAAMMYNIGETSFWSTGNRYTEDLVKKLGMPKVAFYQYCASNVGIKFDEISIGLARTWNLGELLIKSLDQPKSRTKEMNIIHLSNQLSEAISSPPKNHAKFEQIVNEISQLMGTSSAKVKSRIEHTRSLAIELLGSYNASILESYIKPLPKQFPVTSADTVVAAPSLSVEAQVLNTIKALTSLSKTSRSIHEFLTLTMQHLALTFHYHRSAFWVFSQDRQSVECRIAMDSEGQPVGYFQQFSITDSKNIMTYTLQQDQAVWIDNYKQPKWRDHMTMESERLIEDGDICLLPITVNGKQFGIVSVQYLDKSQSVTANDFELVELIISQLNLCLSAVANKRH